MTVKFLYLISATLQFLAFWMAAPELLGRSALERFEKGLTRLISSIPLIVLPLGMAIYGLMFIGLAMIQVLKSQTEGLEEGEITTYYISLGIGTLAYFIFLFTYKRIRKWLNERVSKPLVRKLIEENEVRKNALIAGALLFTIAFILQITALILD